MTKPAAFLALLALTACEPEPCPPPQSLPNLAFRDTQDRNLLTLPSRAGGIDVTDVRSLDNQANLRIAFGVTDFAPGAANANVQLDIQDVGLYNADVAGELGRRTYEVVYLRNGTEYVDILRITPVSTADDCGLVFTLEDFGYEGTRVFSVVPTTEGADGSYTITLR